MEENSSRDRCAFEFWLSCFPGCVALDTAVGFSEPPLLHLMEGEGSVMNVSTCRTAGKIKWLKSKNTFLAKFLTLWVLLPSITGGFWK